MEQPPTFSLPSPCSTHVQTTHTFVMDAIHATGASDGTERRAMAISAASGPISITTRGLLPSVSSFRPSRNST
eukprot:16533-Eustigmatos_ZCMA.PRE.1